MAVILMSALLIVGLLLAGARLWRQLGWSQTVYLNAIVPVMLALGIATMAFGVIGLQYGRGQARIAFAGTLLIVVIGALVWQIDRILPARDVRGVVGLVSAAAGGVLLGRRAVLCRRVGSRTKVGTHFKGPVFAILLVLFFAVLAAQQIWSEPVPGVWQLVLAPLAMVGSLDLAVKLWLGVTLTDRGVLTAAGLIPWHQIQSLEWRPARFMHLAVIRYVPDRRPRWTRGDRPQAAVRFLVLSPRSDTEDFDRTWTRQKHAALVRDESNVQVDTGAAAPGNHPAAGGPPIGPMVSPSSDSDGT